MFIAAAIDMYRIAHQRTGFAYVKFYDTEAPRKAIAAEVGPALSAHRVRHWANFATSSITSYITVGLSEFRYAV